jgi:hypothetical protein
LLEDPDLPAKPAELLALLGGEFLTLACVDLVLADPLLKDSSAMPSSWATFGIDFSDER